MIRKMETNKRKIVGIVSPPYQDSIKPQRDTVEKEKARLQKRGKNRKNFGWYRSIEILSGRKGSGEGFKEGYSQNPQNIGNLPDKKMVGIISPPYVAQSGGHNVKKGYIDEGLLKRSSAGRTGDNRYTQTEGNIANLKDEPKLVGITSPPYENAQHNSSQDIDSILKKLPKDSILYQRIKNPQTRGKAIEGWIKGKYSDNKQNIGNLSDNKIVGITSPPYGLGEGIGHSGQPTQVMKDLKLEDVRYGQTEGNIGNFENKETSDKEEFDITQFHSCDDSLVWHGCYASDKTFKKFIHKDTFAHPAKASLLLMDKIFKHLKKLGLLKEGDVIADFMAGSGRTNIMASLHGFDSIAIELEPHFIKMINQNKEVLEKHTGRKANWEIIQGDSRKMTELIKEKNLVGITSPPYSDQCHSMGNSEKQIELLNTKRLQSAGIEYSDNPNNIGNLPDKKIVGITSPPYSHESTSMKETEWQKEHGWKSGHQSEIEYTSENYRFAENKSKGNIGKTKTFKRIPCSPDDSEAKHDNRPERKGTEWEWTKEVEITVDDVIPKLIGITSPPYEDSISEKTKDIQRKRELLLKVGFNPNDYIGGKARNLQLIQSYNPTNPENLGNQQGESYLSAMFQVYANAWKTMPILCTITKNPTRRGRLRRLDLDTAKLIMTCHRVWFCNCDDDNR